MFQRQLRNLRERYREKTGYYRTTEGRDLSEVTHRVLRKLVRLPAAQSSRVGETKELSPHQFHIPADGYGEPNATTILPGRGNNPFATVAETLWVYAGRNDIETLGKWLPRAREYSDDGKTWTSGYGPRIRNWNGKIDQIETVLRRLRKANHSRQAVIVLWDPAVDGVKEGSRDYTCNILVHFLIRDAGLNLYVTTRSNDIIYGVTINVFEWCFLGAYIAEALGIPFRHYFQTGSSLHLYDWKSDTAHKILRHSYRRIPFVETKPAETVTKPGFCSPENLRLYCDKIYNAVFNDRLDSLLPVDVFPRRLADFYWVLVAETLLQTSGAQYLAVLRHIHYVPLLFSLLDAGQRRRREALWLCKGFSDLWLNTNSEIAAARYLQRLYSLNESHHVQQKGHGNY